MENNDIGVSLVVAMASNRVIGRENDLPWRLPNDLAYFKRITMGLPIIMGRKTFDSIGRPLPGRTNIVVTRQSGWSRNGVSTTSSLSDAIKLGRELARAEKVTEIMLIGGGSLYEQGFEYANRLYITEVMAEVEGDAYFPEFDRNDWVEKSRESFESDEKNPFRYAFTVLVKK